MKYTVIIVSYVRFQISKNFWRPNESTSIVNNNLHMFSQVHVQAILYNAAENIVRDCGDRIEDTELICTWTEGAIKLLTLPSVAPDLQESALGMMVALGCNHTHCNVVSIAGRIFLL